MGSGLSSSPSQPPKLSNYSIGLIVGIGGFGKIKEIQSQKDKRWYALKEYSLNSQSTISNVQIIVNEITALRRLPCHPFIVRLHASFRQGSSIMMILDLFPGGDLRILFKIGHQFTERQVAYVIGAIGSALHHIHLHNWIHRDVKPENIMFDGRGRPKLIDFGIAFPITSERCLCNLRTGTEQYFSPEILVYPTNFHSYETDYWSLGIVMYEMLFFRRPYPRRVPVEMVQYSHQRYESYWSKLITENVNTDLDDDKKQQLLLSSPTHFIISLTDNSRPPSFALPTPPSMSVNKPFFSSAINQLGMPADSLEDDQTLPSTLILPIPEVSSLDIPITSDCSNLLSSLLDVRFDHRYGVGERYSLFETHSWFSSHNIQLRDIHKLPSIITPNYEDISAIIWQKYYEANQNQSSNHEPSEATTQLSPEVEEYLNEIHAMTPLYSE